MSTKTQTVTPDVKQQIRFAKRLKEEWVKHKIQFVRENEFNNLADESLYINKSYVAQFMLKYNIKASDCMEFMCLLCKDEIIYPMLEELSVLLIAEELEEKMNGGAE